MAKSPSEMFREDELLAEGSMKENVEISKTEWNEMKATQQKLLELMGSIVQNKKRNRTLSESDREMEIEEEMSDVGDRSFLDALKKKKAKMSEDDEDDEDLDDELQNAIDLEKRSAEAQKDTCEASESDLTLKEIAESYEKEEKVGPPLKHEALTKTLNKMANNKLDEEKLKEKLERHVRPANFEISVPKVNQEIWSGMEFGSRVGDIKIQKEQKLIAKAAGILATVCDRMIGVDNEVLKDTADAMALMLQASHEMSLDRRARILSGPNISAKYKKLGSNEVPITQQLFGDDLNASLRDIESASKLGREFTQSKSGRKFFPGHPKNFQWTERGRGRGQNWGRGRAPYMRSRGQFRGRGRGMPPKFPHHHL